MRILAYYKCLGCNKTYKENHTITNYKPLPEVGGLVTHDNSFMYQVAWPMHRCTKEQVGIMQIIRFEILDESDV